MSAGLSRRALFGAGLSRALEARLVPGGEAGSARVAAAPAPPPAFTGWGEDDPTALGGRLGPVADAVLARAGVGGTGRSLVLGRPGERIAADDDSLDAVVSLFGASYADDRKAAAGELSRVVRSGGAIAVTAWTGLMGEVLAVAGGPAARSRRWARYETAYLLFFDFPELDVAEATVEWTFAGVEQAVEELAAPATGTDGEDRVRAALPALLERHRVPEAPALTVRVSYATVFARKP